MFKLPNHATVKKLKITPSIGDNLPVWNSLSCGIRPDCVFLQIGDVLIKVSDPSLRQYYELNVQGGL